jgi:hypothetical protein
MIVAPPGAACEASARIASSRFRMPAAPSAAGKSSEIVVETSAPAA